MRISVVLPDTLEQELERCKRQERQTTSEIVRQALDLYFREHRRRAAGQALLAAAERSPLSPSKVRRALDELARERRRSDRP